MSLRKLLGDMTQARPSTSDEAGVAHTRSDEQAVIARRMSIE
ncbi:hypothetical protein [Sphingobium yanoikuyae]